MVSVKGYVFCILSSLVFLAPSTDQFVGASDDDPPAAPTLDVPGLLYVGQGTTIYYSNAELAGQEVVVDIGNIEGAFDQVTIQLDANGDGSANWTPPEWDLAVFQAPDVTAVTKTIR